MCKTFPIEMYEEKICIAGFSRNFEKFTKNLSSSFALSINLSF